ncbi:hypothetical protein JKP88DRAFT_352065, partial [Tribonema minus]
MQRCSTLCRHAQRCTVAAAAASTLPALYSLNYQTDDLDQNQSRHIFTVACKSVFFRLPGSGCAQCNENGAGLRHAFERPMCLCGSPCAAALRHSITKCVLASPVHIVCSSLCVVLVLASRRCCQRFRRGACAGTRAP